MNKQRLVEIAQDAGLKADAYSGRFMYGKECASVYDRSGHALGDMVLVCKNTAEAQWLTRNVSRDNMGKGTVLYWKSVAWAEQGAGARGMSPVDTLWKIIFFYCAASVFYHFGRAFLGPRRIRKEQLTNGFAMLGTSALYLILLVNGAI